MATLLHAAAGLLGARVYRGERPGLPEAAALTVLSFLPDADVVMFRWVAYSHPLGHRGASHSLLAAAVLGLLAGLVASCAGAARPLRFGLVAAAVVASHGLLDTITYGGGLGVGLLWPLDATRWWAPEPWRVVPIAPIGLGMLSRYGGYVLLVEGLMSLPLVAVAMLGRRGRDPRNESRPGTRSRWFGSRCRPPLR